MWVTTQDPLTHEIIGAAIQVSKKAKIGLLESVYEKCFVHEFGKQGLSVEVQPMLPVAYDGIYMEQGFRPDLIVQREVIVEVKAVAATTAAHDAQLINYMQLSGINKGLLFNFHAFPFTKGIKRFVL